MSRKYTEKEMQKIWDARFQSGYDFALGLILEALPGLVAKKGFSFPSAFRLEKKRRPKSS